MLLINAIIVMSYFSQIHVKLVKSLQNKLTFLSVDLLKSLYLIYDLCT